MVYRGLNKTINSVVFSLVVALAIAGCERKTIEKEYYPSGKIKSKVELVNGVREGFSFTYFENGEIKSVQQWENGLKHGIGKHFYENGNQELVVEWKNGKVHGSYKEFYKSGKLLSEGFFINNHEVGTSKFYYKNGSIMEIDYYDSLGNELDYEKYDTLGNLRKDAKSAITSLDKDTLALGEQLVLTGHIGNNTYPVNMLVGKRYGENGFLQDTIATIFPKVDNDGCTFQYTPEKLGKGFLVGYLQEIINNPNGPDSVKVFPFQERYFVIEKGD
jgi:hypothetical protein